ncbi:hypothetical protein N9X24_02115 [Rickettsiales bacterium]|nr:hypothetical protein [Rickettsiales bacterium]
MKQLNKKITPIFALIILFLLSSCTYKNYIIDKSVNSKSLQYISKENKYTRDIAYLDIIAYTGKNEVETNVSTDFYNRFSKSLIRSGLFKTVESNGYQENNKIKIKLIVKEKSNNNTLENIAKIIFTLGVIPLTYDFESQMNISITNKDGKILNLEAKSSGVTKYYHLPSFQHAINELSSEVTTNNVNSIINQMIKNKNFL